MTDLHGMQEVRGSSPLSSIRNFNCVNDLESSIAIAPDDPADDVTKSSSIWAF
jgi:hypothetical protein